MSAQATRSDRATANKQPSPIDQVFNGAYTGIRELTSNGTQLKGKSNTPYGNAALALMDIPVDMARDAMTTGEVDPIKSFGKGGLGLLTQGASAWMTEAANPLTQSWGVDLLADGATLSKSLAGQGVGGLAKTAAVRSAAMGGIGAAAGAITSGGLSAYQNLNDYRAGKVDGAGAAADVLVDTGVGAFTGLGSGVGAASGSMICPGAGTFVGGMLGGMAASALADWSSVDERASASLADTFRGPTKAKPTPAGPARREAPRSARQPLW
jgi:hypothetical protein